MPHITTPHYRLVNLAVALLLLITLFNANVFEPGLFPLYKKYFVYGAFAVAVVSFLLVRPSPEVGPLNVPKLSQRQIRLVSGILLLLSLVCLANYYLLDPGFFTPYKKQVLLASFLVMGLFVVLYIAPLSNSRSKDEIS